MTLRERMRRELANPRKRQAIAGATWGGVKAKWRQWAGLEREGRLQDLRDRARDAKNKVLGDHAAYLVQFASQVQGRGGRVHFAATGAEAVQQVLAICRRAGAERVVKSKSMATEEIGLTHALEAAGLEAVETDLGEYIIQLAGEPPSHIVGPALHMDRHDVADVFSRHLGGPMEADPQALATVARRVLREKFLAADVGITGANFGVAETGTVVLVTNEGNADLSTSLPRVVIAVMGLEKLVASWADLEPLLTLLPRTSTGQNMTSYVTALTGPRRPDEEDGPEELHVVVLDAGRSRLLGTPYQDVLRCMRCGACVDTCPVFRQVGGHGYGTVYSGPIGVALTPLLQGDGAGAELLDACSMCGACSETCPVQIPLHTLIRKQRAERYTGAMERLLFRLWGWAWSDARRYRWVAALVRAVTAPFARRGYLTVAPGPLAEWHAGRDFPAPAAAPFHQRWAELEKEVAE
ncbi:MAG TPA: LutB/LldF family L-lactate oxidation iron-sulfur protein [Symbiobacteriaceae bacterium]|nr:LutB/LldF family L-lactate oxidation iron-sulfur protein [Symbiobacteriaceae bacterium]